MRTVGDLIESVRSELLGAGREMRNKLTASPLSASATSLSFENDLGGITRGAEVVIGDERIYVLDSDKVSKTATVIRGTLGTEAVAHPASAHVDVNPRFPTPSIRTSIRDEIFSWESKICPVISEQVEVPSGSRVVSLPPFSYRVLFVASVMAVPGVGQSWRTVSGWLKRDSSLGRSASGLELCFDELRLPSSVEVQFGVGYDLSLLDDDTAYLEDLGVNESMFDVAKYGACWRLMQSREAARSDINAQGDSRNAEEVGVGQASQVSARYERIRDKRLAEEQSAFVARYPRRWR